MNKTQMILMSAIVASTQMASADDLGWYGSFNLGMAIPYGSLTPGNGERAWDPSYDLDNGGVAGLGGGYGFGSGLRLEGELRYRAFDARGTSSGDFGAPSYADGSLTSTTLMTNLAYDFDLHGTKLRPYLKGGIGAAWNRAEADVLGPGPSARWALFPANTDAQFAWSLGAGLAYPIDDRMSLTAEYQYVDLGSAETGADINAQEMRFDHLGSNEITLGLRYQF